MADISSGSTIVDAVPHMGRKIITVETANTADTADTIAITLADYGISTFLAVTGYVHTTENSIVVEEAPTTAVASGVLTITVGGSTVSNKKRVYVIVGR